MIQTRPQIRRHVITEETLKNITIMVDHKPGSKGFVGNKMFQLIVAEYLQRHFANSEIVGQYIPELEIECRTFVDIPIHHIRVSGHKIDVADVAKRLKKSGSNFIVVDALGMRLQYFNDYRYYQFFFKIHGFKTPRVFGKDFLVINVRAAEILTGLHSDYMPLPISFYKSIVAKTNLRPVFVGQVETTTNYGRSLAAAFPYDVFLFGQSAVEDFATIICAENVVMAISSFSWLACWLSNAKAIHMPLVGFLNPKQRPDIHLVPIDDQRFIFYGVEDLKPTTFSTQQCNQENVDCGLVQLLNSELKEMID